jgi:hypothetical protein
MPNLKTARNRTIYHTNIPAKVQEIIAVNEEPPVWALTLTGGDSDGGLHHTGLWDTAEVEDDHAVLESRRYGTIRFPLHWIYEVEVDHIAGIVSLRVNLPVKED